MEVQRFTRSARPLAAALLLLTGVALSGCASASLTNVSIPKNSPWTSFTTFLNSPYGNLQAFPAIDANFL